MALDRAPEALRGTEPLPTQEAAPTLERLAHAKLRTVAPHLVELLLEHVRHLEAPVEPEQLVELAAATPVEAAAFLEQEELLAADGVVVAAALAPELGLADLVDRLGEVALDVEA